MFVPEKLYNCVFGLTLFNFMQMTHWRSQGNVPAVKKATRNRIV